VPGDLLRDLCAALAGRFFEPAGEANVESGALGAGEARVAGIAQQCVAIGVRLAPQRFGEWAHDELAPLEWFQPCVRLRAQRSERSYREATAGHGCTARQASSVRR
jgi:hypothetical protein